MNEMMTGHSIITIRCYKSDGNMHLYAKAMEELDGETAEYHTLKVLAKEDNISDLLTAKTAELEKVMEDLKQAKEEAMQSWLDSRPLIDELEKMQAELNSTRVRVLKANSIITELQAQLRATDMCIKSAKDEQQNVRMMINDKNQEVHMMQEDTEQLKMKIVEKRRRRSKLKLVLRLKRQTLQTLELTCKAIKLESQAFSSSLAQALYYINNTEAANVMIQLTQEEYACLKEEANKQISQAEWRISMSVEEKLAAEKSRDLGFRRLQNLHPHNRFRQSNIRGQTTNKETFTNRKKYVRAGNPSKHGQDFKGGLKSPTGVNMPNPQRKSKNYYSFHVKKKESIFFRIKTFIVRRLTKYFK